MHHTLTHALIFWHKLTNVCLSRSQTRPQHSTAVHAQQIFGHWLILVAYTGSFGCFTWHIIKNACHNKIGCDFNVVDKDYVGIDAVSTCCNYEPVPVAIDFDANPVPDSSCCDYEPVPVAIDFDTEPVPDSYQLVPVPSDSSGSPPGSMSSTPAKSDTGALSASISAGSSDEPSSDFECFRGPYLNTRDLLLRDDEDFPLSSEPGALSDVSSQPEQLAHPSMEECWLVTPSPCFVGNSQQAVLPASPLEDLLIEHPSMSVYHPRDRRAVMESSASSVEFSPARNQSLPLSVSADDLPPQSPEVPHPGPGAMPPPGPEVIPRRAPRLNHILNSVSTVHPSSWNGAGARVRCENTRSFLDRKNRIRAVVGHGHGYRRSQRMTCIHSGMNNSRHCQWQHPAYQLSELHDAILFQQIP